MLPAFSGGQADSDGTQYNAIEQCFPKFCQQCPPQQLNDYQTPPSTKNKNTCTVFIIYYNNIMSNSIAFNVTDEAVVLLSVVNIEFHFCEKHLKSLRLTICIIITALEARSTK